MLPFVGVEQRSDAGVEFPGHAAVRVGDRGGGFGGAAADQVHGRGLFGDRRPQSADEVGVAGVERNADPFMRLGHLGGVAFAVRPQHLNRGMRHRLQPVDGVDAERLLLRLQLDASVGEPVCGGFGAPRQGFGRLGGRFRKGVDQMAAALLEVAPDRVMRLGDSRDGVFGVGLQRHRSRRGRLGEAREKGVGFRFERLRHRFVRLDDAVADDSAAHVERGERVLGRVLQRLHQRAGALVEAARSVGVGLADGGGDRVGLLAHRLHGGAAAVVEPVDQPIAVFGEIAREQRARIRQPGGDRVAVAADRLHRVVARGGDAGADLAAAGRDRFVGRMGGGFELHHHAEPFAANGLDDPLGRIGEVAADFLMATADLVDEVFAAHAKRLVALLGPPHQRRRARFGRAGERARNVVAQAAKPRDARGAGALDRLRELLGRGAEQARRRRADLADAGGQLLANRLKILRRAAVDARNGGAHRFAIDENRFALIGEFGDQRAQAPLVLARGAFERGQFVADEGFQFRSAGEGAFDAVAHSGDFAADRLGERRELLARHRFRFGQPNRDMGDRGRRLAQVLQSPRERDEADQRHHRSDRRQQEQHGFRPEQQRRSRKILRHPLVAVIGAEPEPEQRRDNGESRRRGARSLDLQRLHDRPGGGAIVVGVTVGRRQTRLAGVGKTAGGLARRLLGPGRGRLQRRRLRRRRGDLGGLFGRR